MEAAEEAELEPDAPAPLELLMLPLAPDALPVMVLVLKVLTIVLPPLVIVVKRGTPYRVVEDPLSVLVATALPPDETVVTIASVVTGMEDAPTAPEPLAPGRAPVTVLVLTVLVIVLPPDTIVVTTGTP